MRRTATLSLFAEEKENNLANIDHLFAINKKCTLQLGIVNTVPNYNIEFTEKETGVKYFKTLDYKKLYGDIVWFPLGVFVMFNPAIAHSMTGVTISMNLKDKMCLLNGDLGGEIHSANEFSIQDEVVDINSQTVQKKRVLIYNIIKELVNHWGNEKLNKIFISQVPLKIKQAVAWTGTQSLYLVQYTNNPQLFYTEDQAKEYRDKIPYKDTAIKEIKPGYDAGFKYVDFTWPEALGELTCNAGQTVTSILDKIIGILGNYEYFYDVQGNFIFQQKPNYLNMTNTAYWTKQTDGDEKIKNLPSDQYKIDIRLTKPVYSFIHNEYTSAFNNTLNYNNVKNDFVVWGARKSINSNQVFPCRFHLAIDKKPSLNRHPNLNDESIGGIILYKDDFDIVRALIQKQGVTDQLITEDDPHFIKKLPYVDTQDWREEIYYQMLQDAILGTGVDTDLNNNYFTYYAELKEEFPKIYDLENQCFKQEVIDYPEQINYFLDFIDDGSQLSSYSVYNIGKRSKIIDNNNEGINCVFETEIPDIVFIKTGTDQIDYEDYKITVGSLVNYGQYWTQIKPEIYDSFVVGGKLNSCYEKIKDLLYQYTNMNETISITTLPIYYLEPNTRITVEDDPAGIYGDYIIQSISLPLDISSTMNINAYKAQEKI